MKRSHFELSPDSSCSNSSEYEEDIDVDSDSDSEGGVQQNKFHFSSNAGEQNQSDTTEENSTPDDSGPVIHETKSQYRYLKRKKRVFVEESKRIRWGNQIKDMSDSDVAGMDCCRKLKCFLKSNPSFLRERSYQYMRMNNNDRRRTLATMLTSNGKYYFDGSQVCAEFLSKAFRFSRHFQSSIKGTPSSSVKNYTTKIRKDRDAPAQDDVITFIQRLAETTADKMPDSSEYHLPFFKKADVYEHFKTEQVLLHEKNSDIATRSYFFRMWKKHCFHVKVRKLNRFTKCSLCEQLRSSILIAVQEGKSTADLKHRKGLHNQMVARERREYKRKRDMATLHPSEYISIIVDGADQSAYGLPHFTTTTKDVRGHSLKVRLVGILDHARKNYLHLYTLTAEFETGANHVIEAIHRFLCQRRRNNALPKTLFVQMDNCSRENKNRYMFAYFEALVRWGVFHVIEVSFLPIGHTHEDIDQTFSCTSERLRHNDGITLHDLIYQLGKAYNDKTVVSKMLSVINWSGLCENSNCLQNMSGLTSFRYFRFQASQTSEGNCSVHCTVRTDVDSNWTDLSHSIRSKSSTFLHFTPDLSKTPPTVITSPPGKDEFTKRLLSEEGRINSREKFRSLLALRDTVFLSREDRFHWDLENVIETNGRTSGDEHYCSSSSQERVTSSYDYECNEFVAVKPEHESKEFSFWIGKVQEVIEDDGMVSLLKIHWYQPKQGTGDIYSVRYEQSFLPKKRNEKRVPWYDTVSPATVIVQFHGLTKDNRIPCATQKLLRQNSTTIS